MGNSTDPYAEWLGVTDAQRPPNHYALLGLPLFEADVEAIAMASMLQMSRVLRHEGGPHGELVQQLSAELQRATDCLSDPKSKAEYDAALRSDAALQSDSAALQSDDADAASFALGPSEAVGFASLVDSWDDPARAERPTEVADRQRGAVARDAAPEADSFDFELQAPAGRSGAVEADPAEEGGEGVLSEDLRAEEPSGDELEDEPDVESEVEPAAETAATESPTPAAKAAAAPPPPRSGRSSRAGRHLTLPSPKVCLLACGGLLAALAATVVAWFALNATPAAAAPVQAAGVVMLDGQPIANVKLTFYASLGDGAPVARAVTDAQGEFQLGDVVPGNYRVTAESDGNRRVHKNYADLATSPLLIYVAAETPQIRIDLGAEGL